MSQDFEKAKRAYEFMMTIKDNDFVLTREKHPQLYATFNELYDEIQAFAKLEGLQVHRSLKHYAVYLIPSNESRYAYSNTELKTKLGFPDVASVFLSDFAVMTLIHLFFDPMAVTFRVKNFVSISDWERAITKQLQDLATLEQAQEEGYTSLGFQIEELNAYWNALLMNKEKGVKALDSRLGFLEKLSHRLVKFHLIEIDKRGKDEVGAYDLSPTIPFEDKAQHFLTKPTTLAFLSQLKKEISTSQDETLKKDGGH